MAEFPLNAFFLVGDLIGLDISISSSVAWVLRGGVDTLFLLLEFDIIEFVWLLLLDVIQKTGLLGRVYLRRPDRRKAEINAAGYSVVFRCVYQLLRYLRLI
jgi:hypothetical protein